MEKINYKGIKPKEIIWVTRFDIDHNLTYCVTSDSRREYYYLYEYDRNKDEWIKTTNKSETPEAFEKIIHSKDNISEVIITDKPKRGRPAKGKLF